MNGGGKQRTDSTYVLAAVRKLQRLEVVGETVRHSLEKIAVVAPDWLLLQVEDSWFERYGARVEQAKLVKNKTDQLAMVLTIGRDGHQLLRAIDESPTHRWLAEIPALQVLRQVLIQQYYFEKGVLKWREEEE